jgi:hypothetical protein
MYLHLLPVVPFFFLAQFVQQILLKQRFFFFVAEIMILLLMSNDNVLFLLETWKLDLLTQTESFSFRLISRKFKKKDF